ncbi:MAG: sugar phosphate nucleotidyltransferase [Deltaproteobacteria bacterium]
MSTRPKTLAMILAGGRVNELSVLTAYRPKSAVPFGGFARVIDFPLSSLMHAGLDRVAILSQYRCYSLINHIGTGAAWDMIGRYRGISILPPFQGSSSSSWYKGSADAVFQNLDFVRFHDPEEILILSGDHVYQMDYREVIDYHRQKDADLTVACLQVPMERAHRFGVADIDDEDGELGGRLLRYAEKPERPEFNWASLTVYCFKPKALYEALEINARLDESFEFGRDIIPRMMQEQKRVFGFKFYGYWGYTRTIEEYWQTSMDLLRENPKIDLEKWDIRTNLEHRNIRDCQPLIAGEQAEIADSLVYNGCIIEGKVERSILFPGVHVKAGALVKDSVLFFDNIVGHNARLNKVVSDVNVTFGNGVRVGDADSDLISVVGWNNHLLDNTMVAAGLTIPAEMRPENIAELLNGGEKQE